MGICSSSGTVGPSLSFGKSDIATVISGDPVLSDACATRLGNEIAAQGDLAPAAESVCMIQGVAGCFAAIGDAVCTCGDVPDVIVTGPRRKPSEKAVIPTCFVIPVLNFIRDTIIERLKVGHALNHGQNERE